jgi:hypothetical protein
MRVTQNALAKRTQWVLRMMACSSVACAVNAFQGQQEHEANTAAIKQHQGLQDFD